MVDVAEHKEGYEDAAAALEPVVEPPPQQTKRHAQSHLPPAGPAEATPKLKFGKMFKPKFLSSGKLCSREPGLRICRF